MPAGNSTYPKVAVQWLNQALCFYLSLCLGDSESLRNRHLRVATKRYMLCLDKHTAEKPTQKFVFFCQRSLAHFAFSQPEANAKNAKRANFSNAK